MCLSIISLFKRFKKNKHYVSPIDQFLAAFDKKNPKSASQQAEIKKHKRIALLRD